VAASQRFENAPMLDRIILKRIIAWLPLAVLATMLLAAKLRALLMQRRGARVIVVDWDRPVRDLVYDTLIVVVAIIWICLLVAEAVPWSLAWLPDWLTRKVVDAMPAKIVGVILLLAAPVLFAAAVRSLGTSWRMGIDRQQPGPLVAASLYAWSRNPIYTAFFLVIVGAMLIHGRVTVLLLGVALILLIHGVVLREERFLTERYTVDFRDYRQRVRRYGLF
jgi:protein-S-isoprenylcysteine O-methyltransferase Ste14